MLNIKTNNRTGFVVFEDEMSEATEAKNSITYSVESGNNLITFLRNGVQYRTEQISNITIDGTGAVAGSIVDQLASLFTCECCCGSGSGGSRNIIYLKEGDALPATADFDDLAIVTTDGTSSGEKLVIYRYDGFIWEVDSFKPNLAFKSYDLNDNILSGIRNSGEMNLYKKQVDNNWYYRITNKSGELVEISAIREAEGFPFIFDNGKDYRVGSIEFYPVNQSESIKNVSGYPMFAVTTKNYEAIYDTLELTDSELSGISVGASYEHYIFKNLNLGGAQVNLNYTTDGYFENIENVSTIHMSAYSLDPIDTFKTTLKNVDFSDGYSMLYLMVSGSSRKIAVLNMESVTGMKSFNLVNAEVIEPVQITNFDSSVLNYISIASCYFENVGILDQMLLALLGTGSTGMPSDGSLSLSANIAPSQSVLDQFTARGIQLYISQY